MAEEPFNLLQVIFSYSNFDIAEHVLTYLNRSDIYTLRNLCFATEDCVLHDFTLLFRIKIKPILKSSILKSKISIWEFVIRTLVTEVEDYETKCHNSQSLCDIFFSQKLTWLDEILIYYLGEPLPTFVIFRELGQYLIDQLLNRCSNVQMQYLYDCYTDFSALHVAAELNSLEVFKALLQFHNIYNKFSRLTGKTVLEIAHKFNSLDIENYIALDSDLFWQMI